MDGAGVAASVVGAVVSTGVAISRLLRRRPSVYSSYRRWLGRSILLGLELLVAADIIRTVAITPTLDSVVVLALIVLIRTFLSFSLELEITGRWPWQKNQTSEDRQESAGQPAQRPAGEAGRRSAGEGERAELGNIG